MNNKSQIFLSAHRECLLDGGPAQSQSEPSSPSDIGIIYLEIAHLYLHMVPEADESDYWISFVFDTCCAVGICSSRYISYLNIAQKRDYINKTLHSRLEKVPVVPLDINRTAKQIIELVSSKADSDCTFGGNQRQMANAVLDYIHVLISIDRTIDHKEYEFFRALRDEVYSQLGWHRDLGKPAPKEGVGGRTSVHPSAQEDIQSETVEQILSKIDQMIGLQNIKYEVRSLINILRVQKLRRDAGLPNPEISNHMVFYGNPGTGKTTIARKLGELYALLGVLSKGHFVETDRSGLVGGFLGQTAIKTTEVLDRALGGILFIDEAYSLSSSEGTDQYGQEAVDTLLKYMEDHRDDLVIILAGYQEPMARLMASNPGLKSRFNKYFSFDDYSSDELQQIFLSIMHSAKYHLDEQGKEHLLNITNELVRLKADNFGNGRTMRNLFERSISNQANRIMRNNTSSQSDLGLICKEDILWEDLQNLS